MTASPIPFPPHLTVDDQAADWLLRLESSPDDAQLQGDCAAWCAMDTRHQAAFDRARRVWDLSLSLSAATPAAVAAPRRRNRTAGFLAVACTVALLATAGVWGGLWPIGLPGTHHTGTGEWSETDLADGSRILLAPQTALRAEIDAGTRTVTLDHGEAFFSASPDPSRPFRVKAGPATVTVTGTRFAVSHRGDALSVQVEEGRVLVNTNDRAPGTAPLPLTAGQALWQRDSSAPPVAYTLPVDAVAPWRAGILAVENRPVADVIDDLRPYLPGLILLTDTALGQQRVTGVYSLHTPQAALRAVLAPFKGQVTTLGPLVTVVSGPAATGSGSPR